MYPWANEIGARTSMRMEKQLQSEVETLLIVVWSDFQWCILYIRINPDLCIRDTIDSQEVEEGERGFSFHLKLIRIYSRFFGFKWNHFYFFLITHYFSFKMSIFWGKVDYNRNFRHTQINLIKILLWIYFL